MLKQRIMAAILALASIVILLETWSETRHNGSYFLKAAAFAPVGIISGIFLLFFPRFYSRPKTTHEKVVVGTVYVVAILAGLFNWYLIDPQVFRF